MGACAIASAKVAKATNQKIKADIAKTHSLIQTQIDYVFAEVLLSSRSKRANNWVYISTWLNESCEATKKIIKHQRKRANLSISS